MLYKAWNSKEEMPYCFPSSSIKFQGHTGQNITDFDPNWTFPDYRSVAAFKSLRFALFHYQQLSFLCSKYHDLTNIILSPPNKVGGGNTGFTLFLPPFLLPVYITVQVNNSEKNNTNLSFVLQMYHDAFTSLSANVSTVFIWKLSCYWLKDLQMHHVGWVRQGPKIHWSTWP